HLRCSRSACRSARYHRGSRSAGPFVPACHPPTGRAPRPGPGADPQAWTIVRSSRSTRGIGRRLPPRLERTGPLVAWSSHRASIEWRMVSAPLVDFHCHLDLYPDLPTAVRRSEEQGVLTLAVTTTPRAWAHNEALTAPTRHVRTALGLHPQLVARHANELALFEALLPRTRYVGEIGLDAGPRFFRSLEQQKLVFERIIQLCAEARDKIVSVHSVRAIKAVLDTLERNMLPTHGRVVLHWF